MRKRKESRAHPDSTKPGCALGDPTQHRPAIKLPGLKSRVHAIGERKTAVEPLSFFQGGFAMAYSVRSVPAFVASVFLVASLATAVRAQSPQYPKPTELPNPYRLVEGWPTLPESMNGGRWGEVIRVHVHSDGNIWVFHRCFNTVPPGIATCLGRGDANPPILQFDPSGKMLKSLGAGMFVNPHGFTVDHEGNLWVSDVNDKQTVLGMSARNAAGVILGQEVLKLDQNGKVLMMLGKMGVGGKGTDTFDRPTGVAVAANGDVFVFRWPWRQCL